MTRVRFPVAELPFLQSPSARFPKNSHDSTTKTTPRGFEPLRAKPIGFLVQLLNHSDTVSNVYTFSKRDEIRKRENETERKMTAVGFEPTPFRTSALSWRLRPLGHAVSHQLRCGRVTTQIFHGTVRGRPVDEFHRRLALFISGRK